MCQTMNVLISDSARRPENSEKHSCAREARPNFNIFWEEIYLYLYFVGQILCYNQRILMEISAFLAKQRFTRIFHENHDLSGFSVKSSIYADVSGLCRNPVYKARKADRSDVVQKADTFCSKS